MLRDGGGRSFEAAVGNPHDAVAGDLQGRVASPISLEGGTVTMEGKAIEFNDEALLRPKGVDLAA